ncbi:hypothetical protein TNCV_3125861 [Trichonephila clavipes]|nr:hypothetical protein TNCV_3125861 [Trichonephila clavipes]
MNANESFLCDSESVVLCDNMSVLHGNESVVLFDNVSVVLSDNESVVLSENQSVVFSGNSDSVVNAARGLLTKDHVNLNHGQVTWMTPELAPLSPNDHTTPAGKRFNSQHI